MIRVLSYSLQALIIIILTRKVFLALNNLDYFHLASNGVSGADIATALQVEYTGLRQLIHETQPLPAISRDFTAGTFSIEDLAGVVRDSSLDGATVLADSLEALRRDARTTAQHLRMFQLKVDGLADRVFGVSSIIIQTLETTRFTSRELVACNIVQFMGSSSPRCRTVIRLPSTFQTFLNMLEVGIETLIMRAVELETSLSRLDERLDVVRDITVGETKVHLSEKDQTMAGVLTQFGANHQRVSLLDQNLRILEMIHEHRRFTSSRISSIDSELQTMKAALEHLRPLASSLVLSGVGSSVSLVMRQIEAGAAQLNNQGTRDLEIAGYEIGVWHKLKDSDTPYPET